MESERVTASGLVYLFGDDFVHLPGSPFLGGQTLLAHRGRAVVQTTSLAYKLFEAAFISLAAQGYISLEMEKTDLPLSLARPPVAVYAQSEGADLPPSLERAIMDALSGAPRSDPVPVVVARVIGGELRRPVTSSPVGIAGDVVQTCKWVVDYVIQGLADADYLWREAEERPYGPPKVHWLAYEEAIVPLAGEAETLKSTLEAFASANTDLRTRLVEEIAAGFLPKERLELRPSDIPFILLGLLGLWLDSE